MKKNNKKEIDVGRTDCEIYCKKLWKKTLKEKLAEVKEEWMLKLLSTIREEKEAQRSL